MFSSAPPVVNLQQDCRRSAASAVLTVPVVSRALPCAAGGPSLRTPMGRWAQPVQSKLDWRERAHRSPTRARCSADGRQGGICQQATSSNHGVREPRGRIVPECRGTCAPVRSLAQAARWRRPQDTQDLRARYRQGRGQSTHHVQASTRCSSPAEQAAPAPLPQRYQAAQQCWPHGIAAQQAERKRLAIQTLRGLANHASLRWNCAVRCPKGLQRLSLRGHRRVLRDDRGCTPAAGAHQDHWRSRRERVQLALGYSPVGSCAAPSSPRSASPCSQRVVETRC